MESSEFSQGVDQDPSRPESSPHLKSKLSEFAAKGEFPISFKGDEIRTVLIGEEHYQYIEEVVALIKELQPSKILHEGLGADQYDPQTKSLTVQPNRMYDPNQLEADKCHFLSDQCNDIYPYIAVSNELHIPVIGCDLSMAEMYIKAFMEQEDTEEFKQQIMQDEDLLVKTMLQRTNPARDQHIETMLQDHQDNDQNPTIAIVGYNHALEVTSRDTLDNYCFIGAVSKETLAMRNNATRDELLDQLGQVDTTKIT